MSALKLNKVGYAVSIDLGDTSIPVLLGLKNTRRK